MSKLEAILEDLRSLPAEELDKAAEFIRQLKPATQAERMAVLERTFGCLSEVEADELAAAIEEGCEQVSEHRW